MGRYRCGPSVLRVPGRPAIVPGEPFEYTYGSDGEEQMALVSGAVALLPGEISDTDRRAAERAAAAASIEGTLGVAGADVGGPAPPIESQPSVAEPVDRTVERPSRRRGASTDNKE